MFMERGQIPWTRRRDKFFGFLYRDKVRGRAGFLPLGWNLRREQQRHCPGMSQHPKAGGLEEAMN